MPWARYTIHRLFNPSLTMLVASLVRNATMIAEETNMTDVLQTLADLLRDHFRHQALKQRLLGALGETLFYVSASQCALCSPKKHGSSADSPTASGRESGCVC